MKTFIVISTENLTEEQVSEVKDNSPVSIMRNGIQVIGSQFIMERLVDNLGGLKIVSASKMNFA